MNGSSISKSTANWLYYPGIIIVVISHIALLINPGMAGDPDALRGHAIVNLIGAALIAGSWFGYCMGCSSNKSA